MTNANPFDFPDSLSLAIWTESIFPCSENALESSSSDISYESLPTNSFTPILSSSSFLMADILSLSLESSSLVAFPCLTFSIQSLHLIGLPGVGLNGTFVLTPHIVQTVSCISLLGLL